MRTALENKAPGVIALYPFIEKVNAAEFLPPLRANCERLEEGFV